MSLQTLLDKRGISMYRLSKMSGVSKTVIIDICSGKSAIENCTVKTVYSIAKVLGLSVEELLKICSDFNFDEENNSRASFATLGVINYITGIHALNIPCSLETSGDWHASALSWTEPNIKNTAISVFKDYGIELSDKVPENPGRHYVANHIRACLDLIEEGRFSVAQRMKEDYICNDKYNDEIFVQVAKLKNASNWEEVRRFMKKEYMMDWLKYEKEYLHD